MATGLVSSFAGNILDIGPMYPFVGSEVFMTILLLVFWVAWHILQIRQESREINNDLERFGNKKALSEVLQRERDPASWHSAKR